MICSIDVFDQLIGAILVTITTACVGYLVQLISKKQKQISDKSKEQADSIAKAIQNKEEAKKTETVAMLLEKLPSGLTAQSFLEKLQQIVSSAKDVSPIESKEELAVESLINSYHEQALNQARVQFWFSVIAATIGFGWIIYTGLKVNNSQLLELFKIVPGIAIDAVAFLFFKQAAETRSRATQLYDRLRTDKQLTESIGVVTAIENTDVRSAVQAQIALRMSGIDTPPLELNNFLIAAGKN